MDRFNVTFDNTRFFHTYCLFEGVDTVANGSGDDSRSESKGVCCHWRITAFYLNKEGLNRWCLSHWEKMPKESRPLKLPSIQEIINYYRTEKSEKKENEVPKDIEDYESSDESDVFYDCEDPDVFYDCEDPNNELEKILNGFKNDMEKQKNTPLDTPPLASKNNSSKLLSRAASFYHSISSPIPT